LGLPDGLMQVAVLLYPGVTAFEALGPYGVWRRVSDSTVHLVADRVGRVPTQGTSVALLAGSTLDDVPTPDIVVVPGGLGIRRLVEDEAALAWVAAAHETSEWTTAVSTGSVLLAAAGVLEGDATTHWLATDLLEEQGAHAVPGRIVRSGKVLTAEGAVAAVEVALDLVARLRGAEESARIREELDLEALGPMDPGRPAKPEVLAALAGGEDDPDALPVYVLGPGTDRRRPRKSAKGRIELAFSPA
jgi:putative intracellular protease/amidase